MIAAEREDEREREGGERQEATMHGVKGMARLFSLWVSS